MIHRQFSLQRGHMELHARNIVIAAGAEGKQVSEVATRLVEGGDISIDAARRLLESH